MRNFIFSFLALILVPAYMCGQEIKGIVTDSNGIGIPGAIVLATNSNISVEADFDGKFSIKAQVGEEIKFNMLGFDPVSLAATSESMNVILKDAKNELKEIIVIGYGTRKKADITGAISNVSAATITKAKVPNVIQSIQGAAAGAQVIGTDVPGSSPSLIIRGIGTFGADRTPLYVVDGIPTKNITNLNPNDIATLEVIKDASASGIYGNQAANGVVIISTKKGKGDKATITYDGFYGVKTTLKRVKMAAANHYAYYSDVALQNTAFSTDQLYNTNWYDEITRTGNYSSNNVSLSGNSEKVNYLLSINNYTEQGVLNGLDYQRFTIRNNNDFKISDKLKIMQTLSIANTNSEPKPLSAFTAAYKQSPIVPVKYPNGQWGWPIVGTDGQASTTGSFFNNVGNPVAQLEYYTEKQNSILLQGSLGFEYKIFDFLKFNSSVGVEYNNFKSFIYTPSRDLWLLADPSRTEDAYPSTLPINELANTTSNYFNWNFDNFFTFSKKFAEIHDVEVMIGMSAQEWGSGGKMTTNGRNVPENSNYWSLKLSSAPDFNVGSTEMSNQKDLIGYFGRLQYKLMDRYLFTGTLRRDGSSQFQEGYQWGTFPAFSAGWIVSEEEFLKENKMVSFLKLRGGWGRVGNQNVPINDQTFVSGIGYSYDIGGTLYSGTTIGAFVDPTLGWEITEETSAGFDVKFLDNRLSGTFDWYNKITTNVILNVTPALTVGTGSTPAHAGEITNKGFEIALRWEDNITDNLKYWVGGTYSNNKNEVSNIYNPLAIKQQGGNIDNGQYTKLLAEGQPVGSFYLYEVAGYDVNGNFTYYDADNNITSAPVEEDREFFGSSLPEYYYGINVGLQYKNIDFSVDGYGVGGNVVYNGKKAQRFGNENIEASVATDFWTPTNASAPNPTPFNAVPISSNYYLESGDFFRINNITLGYTLDKLLNSSTSVRFYLTATNPFISQKFTGYNPELNNDGNPMGTQGIELNAYPAISSYLFGVNLKF